MDIFQNIIKSFYNIYEESSKKLVRFIILESKSKGINSKLPYKYVSNINTFSIKVESSESNSRNHLNKKKDMHHC